MADHHELEEGEIFCDKDDTSLDPDIVLSHIDAKLQNVLGHFQKDFEGQVSAENLGPKYGGYGSFLPTYQHAPSAPSRHETPLRSKNRSIPESNTLHPKVAPGNCLVPSGLRHSINDGTTCVSMPALRDPVVASADGLGKTDSCLVSTQVGKEAQRQPEPLPTKSVNLSSQKAVKIRIKMGMGNVAQKNAAVYSDLGLISPSSPMRSSPEESGGEPLKFQETPDVSPASILQCMTSLPVTGAMLLSPLHDSLLNLARKDLSVVTKSSTGIRGLQKDFKAEFSVSNSGSEPVKYLNQKVDPIGTQNEDIIELVQGQSGGEPLKFQETPDVSPASILQCMTSLPVTGAMLLSPLHDSLLNLARKDLSVVTKSSTGIRGLQKDFKAEFSVSNSGSEPVKYLNQKVDPIGTQNEDIIELVQGKSNLSLEGRKRSGPKDVPRLDTRLGHMARQMSMSGRPSSDREKGLNLGTGGKEIDIEDKTRITEFMEVDLPTTVPGLLNEECVHCDSCKQWRLLSYGTKSDQFSGRPAKNYCDISKDETTDAVCALNQADSADIQSFHQSYQNLGSDAMTNLEKNNHENKEIPNADSSQDLVPTPRHVSNLQEEDRSRRSLNGRKQAFLKGSMGDSHTAQKRKQVEEELEKMKTKRESDEYEYRTPKRMNTKAALSLHRSSETGGSCQMGSRSNTGRDFTAPKHSKGEVYSHTLTVLIEAGHLRGHANNLKRLGFKSHGNMASFQAALKFLRGASMLETSNTESIINDGVAHIQAYSNTADLFETCARDFEEHQEMVAAALAYKCMEVAYMRIVHCKCSGSNRDQHDSQAFMQKVTTGESPSSGVGNHVIVARNRPSFAQPIDFPNDLRSATEASRNSWIWFEAANAVAPNEDKATLVKRVLEFGFQDVEELVRLANEAIGL